MTHREMDGWIVTYKKLNANKMKFQAVKLAIACMLKS